MKKLLPPIQQITFKREELLLPVNGKEESWDYLTIYEGDKVVARSTPHHFQGDINLDYEGLRFFAPAIAKDHGEDYIYVTIASIKNTIKQQK